AERREPCRTDVLLRGGGLRDDGVACVREERRRVVCCGGVELAVEGGAMAARRAAGGPRSRLRPRGAKPVPCVRALRSLSRAESGVPKSVHRLNERHGRPKEWEIRVMLAPVLTTRSRPWSWRTAGRPANRGRLRSRATRTAGSAKQRVRSDEIGGPDGSRTRDLMNA